MQAISEQNGRRMWISGSGGALFGNGTFYSTPAVIYGRVFLGNTDGRVYAYDAFSGRLDWAVQTGAYVYASPAVTNAPGDRPDGLRGLLRRHLLRHQRPLGARLMDVQGPRQDLRLGDDHRPHRLLRRPRHAHDLRAVISTGRVLYDAKTGAFDPVISDGKSIFLSGQTGLYALQPAG